MTLHVNVRDGTGAGKRTVREHDPWTCDCVYLAARVLMTSVWMAVEHPGRRYSCPVCGARRPGAGRLRAGTV